MIRASHPRGSSNAREFLVSSCSLAIVSAFAVLLFGPLLAPVPSTWLTIAGIAGAVAYSAYRLSTAAALVLGEQLYGACDMLRFDVAVSLRMPPIRSLRAERELWRQRSEHALYGTVDDFLVHEPRGPEAPINESGGDPSARSDQKPGGRSRRRRRARR
jgi:hypothetical protein